MIGLRFKALHACRGLHQRLLRRLGVCYVRSAFVLIGVDVCAVCIARHDDGDALWTCAR